MYRPIAHVRTGVELKPGERLIQTCPEDHQFSIQILVVHVSWRSDFPAGKYYGLVGILIDAEGFSMTAFA